MPCARSERSARDPGGRADHERALSVGGALDARGEPRHEPDHRIVGERNAVAEAQPRPVVDEVAAGREQEGAGCAADIRQRGRTARAVPSRTSAAATASATSTTVIPIPYAPKTASLPAPSDAPTSARKIGSVQPSDAAPYPAPKRTIAAARRPRPAGRRKCSGREMLRPASTTIPTTA